MKVYTKVYVSLTNGFIITFRRNLIVDKLNLTRKWTYTDVNPLEGRLSKGSRYLPIQRTTSITMHSSILIVNFYGQMINKVLYIYYVIYKFIYE